MLDPTDLKNFTAVDSVGVAKALGNQGSSVSADVAKNLGSKIPVNTNITEVLVIASAIPLEIFNTTSPDVLVSNIAAMDTENMDVFRKTAIATRVSIFGPI